MALEGPHGHPGGPSVGVRPSTGHLDPIKGTSRAVWWLPGARIGTFGARQALRSPQMALEALAASRGDHRPVFDRPRPTWAPPRALPAPLGGARHECSG